ncbi:MAG: trypsin-like peptidase domain-containing protein [Actinomycetes bacterium]
MTETTAASSMIADTAAKQLLFTTVRVVNRGAGGESCGTGFIIDGSRDPSQSAPVLVTNKHVVKGAIQLELQFIKKHASENRPLLGERVSVTLADPGSHWVGHVDPAVDVAADLDAIEEVIFVGYPDGHYDEAHLTPIVRRGITATPIALPFGGRPVFLLDGSVFGGSSGSPVFIYNNGMFRQGTNITMGQTRVLLVGIIAETMVRQNALPLQGAAVPHVRFSQELNLGVVFTWRAIDAAIDELFRVAGASR